jgi:hypothetical protein
MRIYRRSNESSSPVPGRAQRRLWPWGSLVGGGRQAAVGRADSVVNERPFVKTAAQEIPTRRTDARPHAGGGEWGCEGKENKIGRYALRHSTSTGKSGLINIYVQGISVSPAEGPAAQCTPSDWSGLVLRYCS